MQQRTRIHFVLLFFHQILTLSVVVLIESRNDALILDEFLRDEVF